MLRALRKDLLFFNFSLLIKGGAFYLLVLISESHLSGEELGEFFYFIFLGNFVAPLLSLSGGSFLTYKAYNRDIVRRQALSAVFLITAQALIVLLAAITIAPHSGYPVAAAYAGIRSLSALGEAKQLALRKNRFVATAWMAHGVINIIAIFALVQLSTAYLAPMVAVIISEAFLAAVFLTPGNRRSPGRVWSIRSFRRSLQMLVPMIRYSGPFALAAMANIALISGDRAVVRFVLGSGALGEYGLMTLLCFASYRFLAQPAIAYLGPRYMATARKENTRMGEIRSTGSGVLLLMKLYAIAIFLVGPLILGLLGEEYTFDQTGLGLIAFAAVFGFIFSFEALELRLKAKTLTYAGLVALLAISNLVMSFLLLDTFGLRGAAIAKYVAYLVLGLIAWMKSGSRLLTARQLVFALVLSGLALLAW